MPLEPKDYLTFTFSAAALALSTYNLIRGRLDAKSLNRRSFEQKRFEGVATATEVMAQYTQIEGALQALRFEARLAGDTTLVNQADGQITAAKKALATFTGLAREFDAFPESSGDPEHLLVIETVLGKIKAEKAGAAAYAAQTSNFIEDGRRKLHAASLVSAPSSHPPPPSTP